MKKGFALPKLDLSKAPRIIEDKMGIGLSHPVTSKVLYRKGSRSYRVGAAQMQGQDLCFHPVVFVNLHACSVFLPILLFEINRPIRQRDEIEGLLFIHFPDLSF
jgi:hypothetical protein